MERMKGNLQPVRWSLHSVRDMRLQASAGASEANRDKTFSEIDAPFLEALEQVEELMNAERERLQEAEEAETE